VRAEIVFSHFNVDKELIHHIRTNELNGILFLHKYTRTLTTSPANNKIIAVSTP